MKPRRIEASSRRANRDEGRDKAAHSERTSILRRRSEGQKRQREKESWRSIRLTASNNLGGTPSRAERRDYEDEGRNLVRPP